MHKEITIKDVAKTAGISVSTVSRVLNGLDRVNSKTRKKILKVIEEMNYVPNNVAISMVKKQTKMIVVMIPDIFTPFYTAVVQGVEEVAKSQGYFTFVYSTDGSIEAEKEFLGGMLGKTIDGVISVPSDPNMDYYKAFLKPIILVDRFNDNYGLEGVVIDNFGGAYQATKHLLDYGHRKIAIISGPKDLNVGKERLWGYEQALRDCGVPVREEFIKIGNWYEDNGYNSVQELLGIDDPPTAVLAMNSNICTGVIKALYDINVKIGQDISLVGFDENELAQFVLPKVTVIKRPMTEMGKIAASMILDRIKGKVEVTTPRKITLSTELVIRQSVKKMV